MRAAVASTPGWPLEIREIDRPAIGEGDLLIKVEACGVCFTDLRIVDATGGPFMPLVPGHEPVGTVAEVGPGVTGFAVGDRVGIHALFTCGDCAYCIAGEEEACVNGMKNLAGLGQPGGYGEYMRAPANHAVHLPADVGSSRVDLQACKLEYSIVSPK